MSTRRHTTRGRTDAVTGNVADQEDEPIHTRALTGNPRMASSCAGSVWEAFRWESRPCRKQMFLAKPDCLLSYSENQ